MMKPLEVVKLNSLMAATSGSSNIVVGIIDGPVDSSHPDLKQARLRSVSASTSSSGSRCMITKSLACHHGTFVAGILCTRRGSSAPGICPECSVIVRPIFCEASSKEKKYPQVSPQELAAAIIETVKAGARVINLSIGLSTTSMQEQDELKESYNYAFSRGALLVAASGNHGCIGHIPLFNHPWVIPVASCDLQGHLAAGSNIGPTIGKRGLMAPGKHITSTSPGGGYTKMSGTSAAVPFVTGAIALLWSIFPHVTAADLKRAILLPGTPRASIIPPLLNVELSWRVLKTNYK